MEGTLTSDEFDRWTQHLIPANGKELDTLTVFVLGSGAVMTRDGRSSWDPVVAVAEKHFPSAKDTPGGTNMVFAETIFGLRDAEYRFRQAVAQTEPGEKQQAAEKLSAAMDRYEAIKHMLAKEFSAAQMELRPHSRRVCEQLAGGFAMVCTTNWDRAADGFLRRNEPVLYLHGNIDESKSLYLPTEQLGEAYRSLEPAVDLDRAARAMELTLLAADRIVFYGIGLGPFDAELGVLLRKSFEKRAAPPLPPRKGSKSTPSRPLKAVFIVDPDADTVEKRLKFYGFEGPITKLAPPERWPS